MNNFYDVAVVGLGAMGSSASYHLAAKGLTVLGLDRYTPPHDFGSSHGETRIIRTAYAEGPHYVKMVQRAYELWEELQDRVKRDLIVRTGGIFIGQPESEMVDSAEQSAKLHELEYERISSSEIKSRWEHLNPDPDMDAIYDPLAGVLFPEACIQSNLGLAASFGAELKFQEPLLKWRASSESISLQTNNGDYEVGTLILAVGAWAYKLLADFKFPSAVERQILFWFSPVVETMEFHPDNCPIYVWDFGGTHFYGFPDFGSGVKVSRMHNGVLADPDLIVRKVEPDDEGPVRKFLKKYIPLANGNLVSATVCMFTNTPDLDFVLDNHPIYPNVLIASPCSGHGFKFSSVVGEILADLITKGKTNFDLDRFKLGRFDIRF